MRRVRMLEACQDDACLAREYELSLKSAELEIAYEKSLAHLDSLVAQEESRKSRVDYIILETDHEILQMRCDQSEYDIEQLLQAEKALKQQLLHAQEEFASLQLLTRTESRAMQDLKNDVVSMKRKASDYDKISAEKSSLTKEIAHMKQEFERLQNQNRSYQALVAEKSALERQLNSLEVQLEAERRAFERNKKTDDQEQNEERIQQLKELQEEFKRESDERHRVEQEMQEKSVTWQEQRKVLEERLEKLRKQLRSTKDKLKEQQTDARISHGSQQIDRSRQSVASDRSTSIGYAGAAFDPGMTIATPGAVKVNNRVQRPSAALGEKSVFSITPYLKRNKNATESPGSSDDDMRLQEEPRNLKKRTTMPPKNGEMERSEQTQKNLKRGQPTDHDQSNDIGKMHQPEDDGFGERTTKRLVPLKDSDDMPSILDGMSNRGSSLDGKHRKRKVLGGQRDMTLFDEDDEDIERPRRIERLVPSLKPSTKRPQALGVARLAFGETPTFSPLKRDKRLT